MLRLVVINSMRKEQMFPLLFFKIYFVNKKISSTIVSNLMFLCKLITWLPATGILCVFTSRVKQCLRPKCTNLTLLLSLFHIQLKYSDLLLTFNAWPVILCVHIPSDCDIVLFLRLERIQLSHSVRKINFTVHVFHLFYLIVMIITLNDIICILLYYAYVR